MDESVQSGRCKAFNKRGEPCSSPTVGNDGFCAAHSPGKLDMKALGSLGGKRRTSSVLGIDDSVAADLRPKAKAVLEEMRTRRMSRSGWPRRAVSTRTRRCVRWTRTGCAPVSRRRRERTAGPWTSMATGPCIVEADFPPPTSSPSSSSAVRLAGRFRVLAKYHEPASANAVTTRWAASHPSRASVLEGRCCQR
jgi:hypothetical protein